MKNTRGFQFETEQIQTEQIRKVLILVALCTTLLLFVTGCTQKEPTRLVIADQYGLAYAPVEVMKQLGLIEKHLGDASHITVEWVKMANTQTIREAMIAKNLDVGFMAIPPFLIGVDTGMDWKMIQGISSSPLGLIAHSDRLSTFAPLADDQKIALPQPGSIQHILLSMAAETTFGDAHLFDNQLIAMKHPDGLSALLAKQEVVAHFTAPPYLQQGLAQPGIHQILSGEDAFGGPFTFIVAVCESELGQREAEYEALQKALAEAMTFVQEQPEQTAAMLAKAYNLSESDALEQLYQQGVVFGSEIEGLERFLAFMQKIEMVSSKTEGITQDFMMKGQ